MLNGGIQALGMGKMKAHGKGMPEAIGVEAKQENQGPSQMPVENILIASGAFGCDLKSFGKWLEQ